MEIGNRIDETIRLGLAPLLKQQGFSKSGRNFHRLTGAVWLVVNVHASTDRERLGELMPGGADHWWALLPSTDLAALAAQVSEALSVYGLPWLEAQASIAQATKP